MRAGLSIKVDGDDAPILVESGYVTIRESYDYFVPTATIQFDDRMSSFVSVYPFMQDTLVELAFDDFNEIKTYSMLPFSSVKEQNMQGVESFTFTLDLISNLAVPLLTGSEYHSKKCTASDYIKYIAEQAGLDYEVEDTSDVRSWINPGWTYAQMVRFLAVRSISVSGSAGYLYFVKNDKTLVFKSVDAFFDATPIDIVACEYPYTDEDGEQTLVNKALMIKDNHFANVMLGTNKLDLRFYDYRLGKEVVLNHGYDALIKKRGDVKGVSSAYVDIGKSVFDSGWYSGNNDAPASLAKLSYNKVIRQAESTQIDIYMPLVNSLEVGQLVNLSVPANPDIIDGGVNMNYSGHYIVKSVSLVGNLTFLKRVVLVRPGMGLDSQRKANYL